MTHESPEPRAKVHPATREILPEDPLELHAVEVEGDGGFMLRMLVEEYARMGWGRRELIGLARNPFYTALHALYDRHGEEELGRRIDEILRKAGVARVTFTERDASPTADITTEGPATS